MFKWLALDHVIEPLATRQIPIRWIMGALGGHGVGTILLSAFAGAAMNFMLAGGLSSIAAAIAVWALVKPRVFARYIAYGIIMATGAELSW